MSTLQRTLPQLVDEQEVAEILRISVATVRGWRPRLNNLRERDDFWPV